MTNDLFLLTMETRAKRDKKQIMNYLEKKNSKSTDSRIRFKKKNSTYKVKVCSHLEALTLTFILFKRVHTHTHSEKLRSVNFRQVSVN